MATLYYVEHVHIAQTLHQIPTAYFCVGQESESESVPEFIYGNVNEPLRAPKPHHWCGLFAFQVQIYLSKKLDSVVRIQVRIGIRIGVCVMWTYSV